ncbi:MAG: hypothetical protein ACRD2B_17435 [Terriglobia bacterium]
MECREVWESDLVECLNIEPRAWGDGIVGREAALAVWKKWINSLSFNSAVLETTGLRSARRKVAFGASVFVTGEFLTRELGRLEPGLNSRLIAGEVSGNSAVRPETSLCDSNPRNALDVVILNCNYRYQALNPEQVAEAEVMLPAAFAEAHMGYRIHRVLIETVCERQRQVHESSGVWRTVKSFPECGSALLLLTREDALSVSGSIAAPLFQYQEPILGLRDTDKQLLAAAINGDTDCELATRMNLSLPTVKKRWAALFDRIADICPGLLPATENRKDYESRGPQKRHRILTYIRSHAEEVRPFRWRRHPVNSWEAVARQ